MYLVKIRPGDFISVNNKSYVVVAQNLQVNGGLEIGATSIDQDSQGEEIKLIFQGSRAISSTTFDKIVTWLTNHGK